MMQKSEIEKRSDGGAWEEKRYLGQPERKKKTTKVDELEVREYDVEIMSDHNGKVGKTNYVVVRYKEMSKENMVEPLERPPEHLMEK